MFTQLLNLEGFRKNLAGIVLGDFSGIDDRKYFDDFFVKLGDELNVPLRGGLKTGHEKEKLTFPIGVKCALSTDADAIFILEKYLI
jgi:muramoyltetrapeptide carboxypeptidase LdcA involved in peptidoglycan recycling